MTVTVHHLPSFRPEARDKRAGVEKSRRVAASSEAWGWRLTQYQCRWTVEIPQLRRLIAAFARNDCEWLQITKFLLTSLAMVFLMGGCGETVKQDHYRSSGLHSVLENRIPTARSANERFTLSLATYTQFDRQQQAQQLQQRAQRLMNRKDVWIETMPDGLSVNVGYYTTLQKAKRDLTQVKAVYATLQPGSYQFFYAREIPDPDPAAPPEWDITTSHCYYSLEVATYYNVPENKYFTRKQDAVDAVKALRKSGSPAYYYHGYYESRVLIGCLAENVALPMVELLRQKHPWHYENSYRVYLIKQDRNKKKVRLQKKSFIVRMDEIIE